MGRNALDEHDYLRSLNWEKLSWSRGNARLIIAAPDIAGGSNVKLDCIIFRYAKLLVVLSKRCALDVKHDWCHVREFRMIRTRWTSARWCLISVMIVHTRTHEVSHFASWGSSCNTFHTFEWMNLFTSALQPREMGLGLHQVLIPHAS